MSRFAATKVVKNTISMTLHHSGMNVKTRISKFSNFTSQQLNSACGITKDDGLIDLQLNFVRIPINPNVL